MTATPDGMDLEPFERLSRDLKEASTTLSTKEARFLVDFYYTVQEDRIRSHNQVTALSRSDEPHSVISWVEKQSATLESDIQKALDRWTDTKKPGRWLKSLVGIGPVISAGLLAHIDITRAPTAGHIWRFCLPAGTLVSTPDGYRAVEDTQRGVIVFDRDGRKTGVVATANRPYTGDMVTIKARTLAPLEATANHPIWVRRGSVYDWIPAGEVVPGDEVLMPTDGRWCSVTEVSADRVEGITVYDLQTESSSFVAGNIAVHNSGLDPTVEWEKGQKRPWNAALKLVCWKAGESFVKTQNNEKDVYGHVFAVRRKEEGERNERGEFAEQAAAALAGKKYGHDTNAYKAYIVGKLPDAHLHARARRYATKLFLSHLHHVLYWDHYNEAPPKPYILTQEGHVHYLAPPNFPFEG